MMEKIHFLKNQKYLGEVVEVLVEKYKDGICSGNSREGKLVHFLSSEDMIGQIVKVKNYSNLKTWVLRGEKNFNMDKLPKIIAIVGPTAYW